MASELRVNTINSSTGFGTITVSQTGQDLVGITTIENLTTENTLVGAAASFTGNVQIGGVLTYEDVTNIDSVGLITARQGIEIGARPGVAASISVDGNAIFSGISTFGGNLNVNGSSSPQILNAPTDASPAYFVGDSNRTGAGQHLAEFKGRWNGNDVGRIVFLAGADTSNKDDGDIRIDTTPSGGSSTERLRINSSGRVLIGTTNVPSNKNNVTPSLNVSGSGVLGSAQITRHTSVGGGGALLHLAGTRGSDVNSYTILQDGDGIGTLAFNAADGNEFVVAAEVSAQVDGTPGDNDMPGRLIFKTTSDGASAPTERVRITSSGQVLIGRTSGSFIDVQGTAVDPDVVGGAFAGGIMVRSTDSATVGSGTGIRLSATNGSKETSGTIAAVHTSSNNGDLAFYTYAGGNNHPERMRITGAGDVLIGASSNESQERFLVKSGDSPNCYFHQTSSSDLVNVVMRHGRGLSGYEGYQFMFKRNDGTNVGSIKSGASGTSYNTSSDYRLKENQVTISDGITRLKQLKPYRFNFKDEPSKTVDGFFAHEVTPIVPEAVSGVKDAMAAETRYEDGDTIPSGKGVGDPKTFSSTEIDPQQIDQAKLVPLLTAALQEAIAEIETLKTDVAALKSS